MYVSAPGRLGGMEDVDEEVLCDACLGNIWRLCIRETVLTLAEEEI